MGTSCKASIMNSHSMSSTWIRTKKSKGNDEESFPTALSSLFANSIMTMPFALSVSTHAHMHWLGCSGLYHLLRLVLLVDPSLSGSCFSAWSLQRTCKFDMSSLHNRPCSLWCIDLGLVKTERDFLEAGIGSTIFSFRSIGLEDLGQLIECVELQVLSSAYLCAEHMFSVALCVIHCIHRDILHPETWIISTS